MGRVVKSGVLSAMVVFLCDMIYQKVIYVKTVSLGTCKRERSVRNSVIQKKKLAYASAIRLCSAIRFIFL